MDASLDVWIIGKRSVGEGIDPIAELRRVFGLPEGLAREIARALPRVVKRGVDAHTATRLADTLSSIGWEVELHASRPILELAPGSRAGGDSQRVAAAYPVSLPPLAPESRPLPSEAPKSPAPESHGFESLDAFERVAVRESPFDVEAWMLGFALVMLSVIAASLVGS